MSFLLRRPWHLHHQLMGVVSVVMLLAICMLGGYTALQQGGTVLKGAQTQAATLARNMAISAGNPLLTDSLDVLEELAQRSADFADVLEIRILSPQGQALAHVVKASDGEAHVVFDPPKQVVQLPEQAVASESVEAAPDGHNRLVAWHPVLAGELVGWVQVDYSTRSVDQLQAQIWTNTILVAVFSIGLCGLIVVRFLTRPMRELRQAAEFAVGLNHVSGQQLSFGLGTTEIESLGGALNEASARLHQQMLAMQHQNECLSAIFSLSPDGLVTFDRLGQVQFANRAFLDLTGLAREQVEGATLAQLDAVLLESSQPGLPFVGVRDCFASRAPGVAARLTVRHALGPRVLTLLGQHSESASVSKVLYVCDVTQQQRLDQMKSDFLALAAHELRTPITSIYGYTELMMTRKMPPEQMQEMVQRVHGQTAGMMGILNELLDLSRIEAKRGADLDLRVQDLGEAVPLLVCGFSPPPDRSPVGVAVPSAAMPVRLDRAKLRQMLINLLSNAYKYSPQGGNVSVHFCQKTLNSSTWHGVAVSDQGLGMTPEHVARMGERFFRVDKSGHIPGSGLGVSIVRELAELMGGEVSFSSECGKGTTVTLWFPAVPQGLPVKADIHGDVPA